MVSDVTECCPVISVTNSWDDTFNQLYFKNEHLAYGRTLYYDAWQVNGFWSQSVQWMMGPVSSMNLAYKGGAISNQYRDCPAGTGPQGWMQYIGSRLHWNTAFNVICDGMLNIRNENF